MLDEWGRETLLLFFLTAHWRKPIDFSDETLAQAAAQVGERSATPSAASRAPAGDWEPFAAALDDDFNTPEALAVMHEWRDAGELARDAGSSSSGSSSLAEAAAAPAELVELARAARRGARGAGDFAEADRLRDEIAAAGWEVRDVEPTGFRLVPQAMTARARLRPPRRARGAARAARGARAAGRPSARARRGRGSRRRELRLQVQARARADRGGRHARPPGRRRAGASRTATPTRTSSPPAERPLLVCLDQVTDPRNLGAVVPQRRGRGRDRRRRSPAHGSARVTAAVCRASAGAVEHLPVAVVTNLARYLGEVKGADLWVYGAAGDAETPMWEADLTGGVALVFGAEGKGLRPLVRRTCDARVSIPLAGRVESLNVSVAAALLLYEARRQRTMPEPTLYLFDGYNLLHAAASPTRASSSTCSPASSRTQGARGVVVFDGVGEDASVGPLEVRYAPARRHAARAARRRAPRPRAGLPRLVRRRRARHGRAGGAEALLADVPARPRPAEHARDAPAGSRDRLDAETRARLERLRRGE